MAKSTIYNTILKLRPLLPILLLLLIPQLPPQNLTTSTLRHLSYELNPTPQLLSIALDVRNMLLNAFDDLLVGALGARFFDDKRFGDFAFALGVDAYDYAVVHGWVGEEVGFEFCGGDLETFYFD